MVRLGGGAAAAAVGGFQELRVDVNKRGVAPEFRSWWAFGRV